MSADCRDYSCPVFEGNTDKCCLNTYPLAEHTPDELATLARFEAAEPAPESYVRQHRSNPGDCWCDPRPIPGVWGGWQHNTPEDKT